MTITADVQKLEPGSVVTLYELDATSIGAGSLLFHGHDGSGVIRWQDRDYHPWVIRMTGAKLTTNQQARPVLSVANLDGSITAINQVTNDLLGAKITIRSTLAHYLDDQPLANPHEHFPDQIWYVERKARDNGDIVEYELASALEFGNVRLPRRQIIANQCPWHYRGADCGYTGGPVSDASGNPTSDPAKDRCGKRLSDCKARFGDAELPFGGFPAASLLRM